MRLVCVTNRRLCEEDFLVRLERIASAKPDLIILREKDLTREAYAVLYHACAGVCDRYHVPLAAHTHLNLPEATCLHLPMDILRVAGIGKADACTYGASVHCTTEALEAQQHGASYLIAGHIFETACKPGLAPRGLPFLQEVCSAVDIPVYAIGGISVENAALAMRAGASGVCVMSALMMCRSPKEWVEQFRDKVESAKVLG